ncbi:MAG: hydantoinase B/oxoprolinase family protein [Actinomycetota bacterium]|nr:hydantoinase B/oxoprolinase family protein [Actinomycetota bacterium]
MPIPSAEEKLAAIKLAEPSEDELRALKTLKQGDYEIGFQRTNDILDEALEVFQRSSRSSMGVSGDVMCAIFSAKGDLVNAAAGTYLHAIIQPIIIKYILKYYSENPGVKDGDIWMANDALYGGIHNPDQVIVVPIFYEGELVGWAGAANHTTETGANEPGGMPVSATSRFEEGMNLPPSKIGENHQIRNDWQEMLTAFGIRAPQMIVTDAKARATAADRIRTRVIELCEREGKDFVKGLMRRMLQVAEEGARKRISSWLDGTYRAATFSDAAGETHALVRNANLALVKKGDEITLDFSGTSPENMSPYNAHVQAVVGHVANYVYSYVFYDLPISSATFEPFTFEIPKGTVLNPDDRAATSCSVMICTGVMSACANTFAKMMFASPEYDRVAASASNAGNALVIAGQSQWGLPFADMIAYSINTEGMGGRPSMKGINAFGFPWCPFGRAPNVELMENEFPLFVPLSQHWKDSPGAGKYRGGAGTVQIWVAHQAPMVFLMCIADNSKLQTPQPLFGGYAPATVPGIGIRGPGLMEKLKNDPGSIDLDFSKIIEEGSIGGQWEIEFMGRSVRPYEAGDVMTFGFSAGGAGYGDPLEADPEGVVEDILDGFVSEWVVTNVYKVAYDLESQKADLEETKRLRDAERKARLERGKSWDDFQAEWSEMKPSDEILAVFGSWPEGRALAPIMRM